MSSLHALVLGALAFFAGVAISLQAPINAVAGERLGHPLGAATLSFIVGTLCLIVVTLLTAPNQIGWGSAQSLPPLLWLGGVLGAFYVTIAIVLAPAIGVGALITLVLAGQVTASLVIDHYGWLGLASHEITAGRAVGAVLVIVGALLVRFF